MISRTTKLLPFLTTPFKNQDLSNSFPLVLRTFSDSQEYTAGITNI